MGKKPELQVTSCCVVQKSQYWFVRASLLSQCVGVLASGSRIGTFDKMKTLCFLLLLPVVVLCDGVSGPPPQPVPTTTSPPPTTIPVPTLPPSPNTTTVAPNTTTTSTTTVAPNTTTSTTTVAPNTTTTSTTTVAPNTTTTSTTTVAPNTTTTSTTTIAPNTTTTSTTTIAPNTTTTPAPAPSPTPTPEPAAGTWTVRNATSNVTCVKVNMAIRINVTYSKTDNKTGFAVLNVPKDATGNGTCGNETQMLKLEWPHHKDNESYNWLEMFFEKNVTEKKFMVHNITLMLSVNPDDFPNATESITGLTYFNNRSWFATSLTRSYRCMKSQEVSLFTNGSNETMGMLTVSKVQLEAFHETNSTDFGAVEDCERSTDIVPITVGCALVGLVAVVLIGYLVGRRRSQARGYLSM